MLNHKEVLHDTRRILGDIDPLSWHKFWGRLCVLLKNSLRDGIQRALTGFAAGVMAAASVWSLLIPAMEQAANLGRLAFFPAAVGFWLGILFCCCWTISSRICTRTVCRPKGQKPAPAHHHDGSGGDAAQHPGGYGGGRGLCRIPCRNCSDHCRRGLALSLGIAIQNFPEGAIISMPLRAEGMKKAGRSGAAYCPAS